VSNPFVSALLGRLENRYSVDRQGMTTAQWIEMNTTLMKRPFSFKGYEFQRAIVDDLHPKLSVIKISQVGMTEVQIRKMLAMLSRNNGTKGIFTMPNEKMFKRISKTRIQPTIEGSDVFNPEGSKDWTRAMDLIQFDQSFLYITGATEGDATSIDADFLFNDEVDLTDKDMLALFLSRMQNSRWRINQRFSTPTHVGFGIDQDFGSSDQLEYLCRCHSCRYWENIPDFTLEYVDIPGLPDHIEDLSQIDVKMLDKLDIKHATIKCKRCGAPLDLDGVENRRWVPRFAERSDISRGYYVRPFVTSRLDVPYIVTRLFDYKQKDFLRGWYNTVLGKAYTDSNSRLSIPDIKANLVHPEPIDIGPDDPCFLGIDAGLVCHVAVAKDTAEGPVVCRMETVPGDKDQIVKWVAEFEASHRLISGAMDRAPFTPTANAVFEASKGKVFPVEYRGSKEINPVKNLQGETIHFQADRTALLDAVAKRIQGHKLPMAGYGHYEHIVVEHLRDMVRDEQQERFQQDARRAAVATWIKLNGNDHYFHALGFLLFSMKIPDVLELLSDAEVREMVSIIGVDLKQSTDVLSGTSKRGLGFRRFG
jgi:hypothetical protein